MTLDAQEIYDLLPAIYRTRDALNGGPLQALFAMLAEQAAIVEDNIQQLYDDQFIETCAPWVIPYIGDLIGYNSIFEVAGTAFDSRAEVANTIGYRRRKGTLIALQQVARDVSGRPAVVVECFRRLIVTESMRHPRPRHVATADIRNAVMLNRFGTAFDRENYTVDVRRIAPRQRTASDPDTTPLDMALHGGGRFNIPDLAIHLWRWNSWQVVQAAAVSLGGGRYTFSPLGQDMPLFSVPPPRTAFDRLSTRLDVPLPIDRTEFCRNTRAFYGSSVMLLADGTPVDVTSIVAANLADAPGQPACTVPSSHIAIDPELGRIQLAADVPVPLDLRVTYAYGYPAELGGGPYDRSASLEELDPATVGFFALVGSAGFPTLESAVVKWNALAPGESGLIVLPGFERYAVDLSGLQAIELPAGSSLSLVAAVPATDGCPQDIVWNNSCVTLVGDIEVECPAAQPLPDGTIPTAGQLLVSGVWLAGQLRVSGGSASIQVADATLVPGLGLTGEGEPIAAGEPSIIVAASEVALTLNRSISGPISAAMGGTTRICSCIVDSTSPYCVAYAGPGLTSTGADLHVEDSTIVGKVHTRTMSLASNTIFWAQLARRDPWQAAIWADRRQTGCMRFCSLPFDSITPRRYNCLPPDAASQPALEPRFITLRYGRPSYALLSGDVPVALWRGADNGSQIGAYLQLQETEAVVNVQVRAQEYVPVGQECGIFLRPSRPIPERPPAQAAYGAGPRRNCADHDDEPQDGAGIGSTLLYG